VSLVNIAIWTTVNANRVPRRHLMYKQDSLRTLQVTVFDIRPAAEAGVETIVGDLRKPEGVNEACEGAKSDCDIVPRRPQDRT
jgi:hypothetical protein